MLPEELFFRSVREFEMTVNTANCLAAAGIHSVADLAQKSEVALRELRFTPEGGGKPIPLHKGGVAELQGILSSLGLSLGMEVSAQTLEKVEERRVRLMGELEALKRRHQELRQKAAPEAVASPDQPLPELMGDLEMWKDRVERLERKTKSR